MFVLQQVTGRNWVTLIGAVLWRHTSHRSCFIDVWRCNVVFAHNKRKKYMQMSVSQKYLWDSSVQWRKIGLLFHCFLWPGTVARSEASSLCMQAAPSSIPTSGTFFCGDLVMKIFLRPFSLFHWFKKSSCQLLAKECALSTGKLPRRLAQEQCG